MFSVTSPTDKSIPPCRKCQRPSNVRPIHVSGVAAEVQYWSCEACVFVFATRDGEELRSVAADRTPRKSA